jgi:maltose alpha-D-glucosyltransferase/alpha-amylase
MTEWEGAARAAFLDGYRSVAKPGQAVCLPATWEEALRVIHVYELDKALYELRYEMRNRPDWLSIPLQGILCLVGKAAG